MNLGGHNSAYNSDLNKETGWSLRDRGSLYWSPVECQPLMGPKRGCAQGPPKSLISHQLLWEMG